MLGPDTRHHHVADFKLAAQFARAPLSRAVWRFAFDRPLQDASFECRRKGAGLLSGVPAEQSCQPFLAESFHPSIDEGVAAIQLVSYRFPGAAVFQQKNQSGSARIICTPVATGCPLILFHTLRFRQQDRGCHTMIILSFQLLQSTSLGSSIP